jgi:hypothetical protein
VYVCVFVYSVCVRSMNIACVISRTVLEMFYQIKVSKKSPVVSIFITLIICI